MGFKEWFKGDLNNDGKNFDTERKIGKIFKGFAFGFYDEVDRGTDAVQDPVQTADDVGSMDPLSQLGLALNLLSYVTTGGEILAGIFQLIPKGDLDKSIAIDPVQEGDTNTYPDGTCSDGYFFAVVQYGTEKFGICRRNQSTSFGFTNTDGKPVTFDFLKKTPPEGSTKPLTDGTCPPGFRLRYNKWCEPYKEFDIEGYKNQINSKRPTEEFSSQTKKMKTIKDILETDEITVTPLVPTPPGLNDIGKGVRKIFQDQTNQSNSMLVIPKDTEDQTTIAPATTTLSDFSLDKLNAYRKGCCRNK